MSRRVGPLLSVLVPTLNEEVELPRLLADVAALPLAHEVIVADGGSTDATVQVAGRAGAHVVRAAASRGVQLRAAADRAVGGWLLILHADVRVDRRAREAIAAAIATGERAAFVLRLRINASKPVYRLVEWAVRLRTRWLRLPYGDQGLLLPRALYDAAGGYPAIPIMEDVVLADRLRRIAPLRVLNAAIRVSARRWERDGALRRTLRNWKLLLDFRRGASPEQLAAHYTAHVQERRRDLSDGG